jgi:membrane protein YqaA with SNARE-associated domain
MKPKLNMNKITTPVLQITLWNETLFCLLGKFCFFFLLAGFYVSVTE